MIAGKDISTMSILCRLMLSYQPGGLSEKAAILSALDSPEEAQSLAQAVVGLRKWLRWHRRAGEVGVTRPDATIQVKGLGRLVKKILRDNADLAFRIQLAKSSLQIDTAPTEGSVMTYANHLLAEVEQIAHQDKRRREKDDKAPDLKLKKAEEGMKGDGRPREDKSGGAPCRFFLSDEGCKKGGLCAWVHQLDDRRRCWTCGSLAHFSSNCDRPSAPSGKEVVKDAVGEKPVQGHKGWDGKGKPMTKTMKKEEPVRQEVARVETVAEDGNPAETMKELLEEANRMLRKVQSEDENQKRDRIAAMQAQLEELKKMKVLRLSRIEHRESKLGLLDSGATHPMRGRFRDEDTSAYEKVKVTLADGGQVEMSMTTTGVMVLDEEEVEPILPMGALTGKLGYTMVWGEGKVRLTHPDKGEVKVKIRNGCPQIAKKTALRLIQEIEEGASVKKMSKGESEEVGWLRDLTEAHPVLRGLPQHVREKLAVEPAETLRGLPGCNRRRR